MPKKHLTSYVNAPQSKHLSEIKLLFKVLLTGKLTRQTFEVIISLKIKFNKVRQILKWLRVKMPEKIVL